MLRSFSRRSFLSLLGLSGAGALTARGASGEGGGTTEVLRQRGGEGACGPCAIGNAMLRGDAAARRAFAALPGGSGDARVDALIARYGAKPSETYGPKRARFEPGQGITNDDLVNMANDFLRDSGLPGVRGVWLDRVDEETGTAQIRRVHGLLRSSLAHGMPAIVEIRSFAADPGSTKEPWINLGAHWLAVASVEADLAVEALGFGCRFADSSTGRVIPAFVSADIFRTFGATKGFKLKANGDKEWVWVTGRPYLQLMIPDLPLYTNTRPNAARAVIPLTHALLRTGSP